MEKKLRRLLVLLATVVLLVCALTTGVFATEADEPVCYTHGDLNSDGKITHRDAIYLLYASFGNESYALNQDGDFDGDKSVTQKDAFYLLYASFGDEDCPLEKERIHIYSEPVWNWIHNEETDEYGVTAKFTCECGESKVESDPKDVTVKDTKIDATCTKVGSRKLEAALTLNGKTYTSRQEQTLEMIPHEKVGELSCLTGVTCKNCDYEVEALGHSWVQDAANSKAATCSAEAVTAYACENCDARKYETVADSKTDHIYIFDTVMGMPNCQAVNTYKCKDCGTAKATAPEDITYTHKYTATLTKEATCSVEGEKTYTCSCGDSYTKEIPADAAHHDWDSGETANGITTYTCSECDATKTAAAVANNEAVDKEALVENGAVNVADTAEIKLDDATKTELAKASEIKFNVEAVSVEETKLAEAKKNQVDTVYEFTVTCDGEEVSTFAGAVTVSLPYELGEEEDIDSIDVWYIADDGSLQRMNATYSNGYVTFTTTHFSYYTVTRLTAAERCARYGHALETYEKAVSCTADGYKKVLCTRCGKVESDETIETEGHTYNVIVTDKKPTCTATGLLEKACSACSLKTSEVIPALGHKITTETKNATCEAAGETHIKCENCDLEATEILAKLNHNYGAPEIKEATCTEGGYTKAVCADCGYESISGETPALGHAYEQGENAWSWAEDYSAATVTLVCANDEAHTKVLNAVVTIKTVNATCTEAGNTTYTATAAYGGKTYTATKSVSGTEAAGHKPAVEWSSNAAEHYHVCSVCKEKLGAAAHTWGAESVIKAPTCTTVGTAKVACTICGYETEKTLPATGEHTYVNGVCTGCGHKEDACEHLRVYKTEIDLSGYNICEGTKIFNMACDCGEKSYPNFQLECNLIEDEEGEEITLPDGTKATKWVMECTECDLKVEYYNYSAVAEDVCAICWYEVYEATANGALITEGTWISEPMEEHPPEIRETFNMADYGMCDVEVEVNKCPCGFATYAYYDGGCDWVTVEGSEEDLNGDGILSYTFECSKCGAIRERDEYNTDNADSCVVTYCEDNTYYVDGEAVLELNEKRGWSNHNYVCESYELDGESCMDGLLFTQKCQKCGDVNKRYVNGHYEIVRTIIDMPADVCIDALIQYNCPCDAEYGYWEMAYEDLGCDWVYNEENGVKTHTCRTCGLVQTVIEERSEKDEFCGFKYTEKRIFADKNGNHLATVYNSWMKEEHNMVQDIKLLVEGGKCTDGVEVTNLCTDCGYYWSDIEYDHVGSPGERYDLSDMYMCCTEAVHYTCACGESDWISFGSDGNYCAWNYYGMSDDREIWVCVNCDATRTITREELERIDSCHVKSKYIHTIETNAPEAYVIEVELVDTIHAGEWFELELFDGATDCTGGVDIYMNCDVCGVREHWGTAHGHETWPVNTEVLCEEGLCSTLKRVDVSCACGYEQWTYNEWEGDQCNFQYGEWDEELQMSISRCVNCGAGRTRQSVETPVEGEPCRFNAITAYTFYDKDKNELCSYEVKESGERHDEVCTFRMNGTTCQEGYYVDRICQDCGWNPGDEEYRTDCETWCTAKEYLYTSECGEVKLAQWTSPCGERNSWNVEGDCQFYWMGWDELLDMEVAECTKCGLKVGRRGNSEQISGTCSSIETEIFVVLVDGEEVASAVKSYSTKSHEYIYTFNMQGDTCEDGYTISGKCAYCDATDTSDYIRNWHETYRVGYYNLADYGMCGGEIWVNACPCGKESHRSWNGGCGDYEYTSIIDEETGEYLRKCNHTGVYYLEFETGAFDHENCLHTGTYYLKVFGTDPTTEPVLNVKYETRSVSHTYKANTLTLLNPEGDCTDGVYAAGECIYCGDTFEDTYHYHQSWTTDILDLSQYATCGGQIRTGSGACGCQQFTDMAYACQNMQLVRDWYEEDENGIGHHYWERTCSDCGLTYVEENYDVDDPENCERLHYWIYTFTLNGEEIATLYQNGASDAHDTVVTDVSLHGVSCEDGATVTETCQHCGAVITWDSTDHNVYKTEAIDLTQYGVRCGETTLDHYACACGAYERYNLNTENACDVDQQSVPESEWWVSGAINEYQETTEGTRHALSGFYNLKCGVSEPACGLNMKMAEYWLKDGCQVTEYQNWQILDADGNVVWEDTVTTGETMGFHDYTRTESRKDEPDGSYVNTYSYICNDCGSTYEYQDSYNSNGEHIKFEGTAINNLDNGENQKWYRYWIREDVYNGFYEIVEDYDEWIRANGETDWNRYEYTFGYPESCTQICQYSNSDGHTNTWTNEAHIGKWHNDRKSATCTQFGYYEDYGFCDNCGTRWSENYEEYAPYCHDWDKHEETDDYYYCTYCGLESTQGASGAIVMEDLSGYYHQGFSYIVGYYNPDNIGFVANVSVILEDSTEEDNQIDLDVPVWDLNEPGVNAKYVDKGTADTAAQVAMMEAGYTGNYAIRITFVFEGSGTGNDYAITFENLYYNPVEA